MTPTRMPPLSHEHLLELQERTRNEPGAVVAEATALLPGARAAGDPRVVSRLLTVLAHGLMNTGEAGPARAALDEALDLAGADPQDEARVRAARVLLFVRLGEATTVDEDAARLDATVDALRELRERASACNVLAGYHHLQERPDDALGWLDRAARAARDGGDAAGATAAATNAAIVNVALGRYAAAVTALRTTLHTSSSPQTRVLVLSQLALLYSNLGLHSRALEVIGQHFEERPDGPFTEQERILLTNRAETLLRLHRPEEAVEVIETHELSLTSTPRVAGEALETMGRAYMVLDRPGDARETLRRSVEVFTTMNAPRRGARPLIGLAELELARDAAASLVLCAQAHAALGDDAPPDLRARLLLTQARAHAALGEYREAYAVSEQQRAAQDAFLRQRERQRLDVALAELEYERAEATARIQREALQDARREVAELHAQLEARVQDRTRELQTANEELRAFSRSVSHYLRTPMQLIVGHAALLPTLPPDRQAGSAGSIIESTERMAEVLDGLLSYATRGGTPIVAQRVDLGGVVRAAWEDHAGAGSAELVVGPLPAVRGDPAALRVVFGNLLHNAVKFTRVRPQPRVTVTADVDCRAVTVEVRDNGVGFDPADAVRVFGTFTRLPTVTRFEGLGLGLADVWRIVIAHGGHVRAEGRPDEGASFFVTLPAADELPGPA